LFPDTDGAAKKKTRKLFTEQEDEQIMELVGQYGDSRWKQISSHLTGRSALQCKEPWFCYLAPHVTNDPWSKKDDKLLLLKASELNHRWKQLEVFFPGRSNINIKNHWRKLRRMMPPKLKHCETTMIDFTVFDRLFGELVSESEKDFTRDSLASQFCAAMFW
jgi:hypothetical protein